jgi:hypothetical protein
VSQRPPYELLAGPVAAGTGPGFRLCATHWSRLRAAGYLPPVGTSTREERIAAVRVDWPMWDADDYCLDAPSVIPAGSCVEGSPSEPCWQRAVRRGM